MFLLSDIQKQYTLVLSFIQYKKDCIKVVIESTIVEIHSQQFPRVCDVSTNEQYLQPTEQWGTNDILLSITGPDH